MAADETSVVELMDEFYRDSFGRVLFIVASFAGCILVAVGIAVYLSMNKPPPITFPVDIDMRVQGPIPLNQPYLSSPDLLQWVADVVPRSFVVDFNHYNDELKAHSRHFTQNGWTNFLNQLNIVANYNNVQAYKLFVTSRPTAAPYILREGVIPDSGVYGWWVQMPVIINYDGLKPPVGKQLVLQVLVIRVSTLNNLLGVQIDNVIQAPESLSKSLSSSGS